MQRAPWPCAAPKTLLDKHGGTLQMSKGYWRTDKLTEQFNPGKCATDRVKEYVSTWESRCYQFGIPDEVPRKIAAIGRAPSWQAVAIALLKNDLNLYGLGFSRPSWQQQQQTIAKASIATIGTFPEDYQLELFNETYT
jgi:hypothetical protein